MSIYRWGVSSSDLFLCLLFFDVCVYVQNKRADFWILRRLLGMDYTLFGMFTGYTNGGIKPVNLVPIRKLQGFLALNKKGKFLRTRVFGGT